MFSIERSQSEAKAKIKIKNIEETMKKSSELNEKLKKLDEEIKQLWKQISTLNTKIDIIYAKKVEINKTQTTTIINETHKQHKIFFILPPWRIDNNVTNDEQLNKKEIKKIQKEIKKVEVRINEAIKQNTMLLKEEKEIKTTLIYEDVNKGDHLNNEWNFVETANFNFF